MQDKRNLIIHRGHMRGKRMWQFFFTGWGLVCVAVLVASALMTRQLLFTPLSLVDIGGVAVNRFQMTNAEFFGTDKDGEPFEIRAKNARQEYDNPDIVYVENVSGKISRITNGARSRENISANSGVYNIAKKMVTLKGNVKMDSTTGDRVRTEELVIKL